MAADVPRPPERRAEAQAELCVVRGDCPDDCGTEVVVVDADALDVQLPLLGEAGPELRMCVARFLFASRFDQALDAVLPNRFQHRKACRLLGWRAVQAKEGFVDERGDSV